ncbi:hypothetical protein P692DRAFT_20864386 [Suillus brevipes Sb2]|nr:hypothetical protein P692DRAFT_20864386 [Suillus brevipes Sb2]
MTFTGRRVSVSTYWEILARQTGGRYLLIVLKVTVLGVVGSGSERPPEWTRTDNVDHSGLMGPGKWSHLGVDASLALPKPVASCDTDKIHQISRVRMRTSVCKLFWSVESKMTGIRRCCSSSSEVTRSSLQPGPGYRGIDLVVVQIHRYLQAANFQIMGSGMGSPFIPSPSSSIIIWIYAFWEFHSASLALAPLVTQGLMEPTCPCTLQHKAMGLGLLTNFET